MVNPVFKCKRCHADLTPPVMPLCEMAAEFQMHIKAQFTWKCWNCGKKMVSSFDSDVCAVGEKKDGIKATVKMEDVLSQKTIR